MNTLSGVAEPYSTLTLDGLNATSTLIEDAVGDYLPLAGGTLVSSTGTTRLGIAASTLGTLEYFTTAGVSQASMFYNIGTSELRFNIGTATNVLRIGGTTITYARPISMGTTNKITNLSPGTTANDAVNYGQTMLRSGANAATADIPMGGFKLTGLGTGVAGTDAATVSQLAAYLPLSGGTMTGMITGLSAPTLTGDAARKGYVDTGNASVTSAFQAADTVVTNAYIAADTVVTNAYIAADTVVTNAYIAANTAQTTSITSAYVAADTVVTNAYIAADTVVTNAFTAADSLRVRHDGSTAMTGSLNMNSNSVNNCVNVRSPTNTDLVLGRTGTGTEIQIKATEILVGKDVTLSGANINTGTGSIKTASTANGSLTIADPSSSLTTVTFRNEFNLFGNYTGTCQLITEASAQVWIKADVVTHAKQSGIQLDAASFYFFTGDPASATQRLYYDATATNELNVYGGLNMRTNRVYNVGTPTLGTDATTKTYVDTAGTTITTAYTTADNLRYKLDGTVAMTGNCDVGNHKVVNMLPSTANTDGVRHDQVINKFVPLTGGSAVNQAMTGQLYMGNNRIGSLSPGLTSLDAVNYQQVAESSIPLTAWRSGETIQTIRKSPAFSQNLTNTSCSVATAQVPLVSTSLAVIAGNYVVISCTFECSSTAGGGDDHFRIVYEYGTTPQTVTYNYNLGAPTGFRNRVCSQEYCFLVPNTGTKTILARLYNDGNDTMTIDDTNWSFVVREIKA